MQKTNQNPERVIHTHGEKEEVLETYMHQKLDLEDKLESSHYEHVQRTKGS